MSMRDSINRWKEKRHISHSGIPSRPATAWNGSNHEDEHKTLEQVILAAFESQAFKAAIASQLDPTISKLNQIKASNLNLESTLQTHIADFQSHVTVNNKHLDTISEDQNRAQDQLKDITTLLVPIQDLLSLQEKFQAKVETQLNDLFSGQTKFLKTIESRFDGLESRIEEIDSKTDHLEESVVNADLRSAIRFGELSNELQDRNTLLGDRIWEVQRDLGKKIDGQQRKVLAVCEELGKNVRGIGDSLENTQARTSEELSRTTSSIEASEKVFRKNIAAIQEKVTNIPQQLQKSMSEITKEIEEARNLSSSASSSSASQLEGVASVVKRIETLAASTNEISQKLSKSQATTTNLEAVQRRIESLATSQTENHETATSNTARLESALIALDAAALNKLDGLRSSIEDVAAPLSSYTSKLDNLESTLREIVKNTAQQTKLHELSSCLSEMRSNIDSTLFSQGKSLEALHEEVTSTTPFDHLREEVSSLGKNMADYFHELGSTNCLALNELGELKATLRSNDMKAQVFNMEKSITQNFSAIKATQNLTLNELGEIKTSAATNHSHVSDYLASVSQSNSTKDDIAALQTAVLETLAANGSLLEEVGQFHAVAALSAKMDEFAASTSASIRNIDHIVHTTTRSTADEIHEHIKGLDGTLDTRFSSMTEIVHERMKILQEPITKALEQTQASKASLQTMIREEHHATRASVESGKSSHAEGIKSMMTALQVIRETRKEDEILHQMESLGQQIISNQESNTSKIVGMLHETKQGDQVLQKSLEELETTSSLMSERLQALGAESLTRHQEIKSTVGDVKSSAERFTAETSAKLKGIHVGIQHIQEDPTISNIKQLLLQNASSMATSYEGILAIDTKIGTSEDSIHSAIQDMQTTLGRDILDSSSSITTSLNDNLGEVKVDLASRISTSTNVLRAEMKRIDLTQTASALELLKDDIQSISKMSHNDMDGLAEKINFRVDSLDESLTKVFTEYGKSHKQSLEQNAQRLSQIEDATSASLVMESTKLQELLDTTTETKGDLRMVVTAVQGFEHGVKTSTSNTSHLQESIHKLSGDIRTLSDELKDKIETSAAGTSEAVKDNLSILAKIVDLSAGIPDICEEIKSLESSISERSEQIKGLVISNIAAATGEVLSVRSDIGGIVSSLSQADNERRESEKIHASVLSTVKGTSTDLHKIENILKQADNARQEALTALKEDISALGKSVSEDTTRMESTTLRELGDVHVTIEKAMDGVGSKIIEASLDTARTHEGTLALVKSESESIRDSMTRATEQTTSLMNTSLASIEKSLVSELKLVEKSLTNDLRAIDSTARELRIGLEGISNEIDSMAGTSTQNHDAVVEALQSEAKSIRDSTATEVEKWSTASETGMKKILCELESTKKSFDGRINTSQSSIQEVKKTVESMSTQIHVGFENLTTETAKTQQAVTIHQSEAKSISDTLLRELQNTGSNLEYVKGSISSEVQDTRRVLGTNITEVEKSIQRSMEHISNNVSTGFSEATSQRRESRNIHETKITSMVESLNHGFATAQNHVESAHNRMVSVLQKTTFGLESNIEGLKLDFGNVSKTVQSFSTSVKKDIESLGGRTVDGFETLEDSVKHTNAALERRIGDTESSLQTNLENIAGSMKAVDAAVRVNSAAIARVDKAVLETGSQVKNVVLDGNRDMLFQLDEELHENGTRIRGISEFDIPRIEALGKRNRVALEVIGARVLGTAKKFDEMIAHHSQKVLEHSEILNGRLRGGSNASSRDSGLRMSGLLER